MRSNRIIYWTTTGLIGAMMLFSAFSYFTNPEVAEGFRHLGFPDYFRVELGIAKIIGAIALLLPQVPVKFKEWAYAGFAITFVSASIGHFTSGDPLSVAATPLVFMLVLIVSNIYLKRVSHSNLAQAN
jgi:hypothetical protein